MYLNTFVNTFLCYFQNIVLIHSIHYKFENERNIRHKISSIIQYVNNITDMHVIYYITSSIQYVNNITDMHVIYYFKLHLWTEIEIYIVAIQSPKSATG